MTNAERQRLYRQKQRNALRNASEGQTVTESVTPDRNVTPVTECSGCAALREVVDKLTDRMDALERQTSTLSKSVPGHLERTESTAHTNGRPGGNNGAIAGKDGRPAALLPRRV